MNRQLRANGGIMNVTPRENFGIGSSLKKFVRKIIPNEIADIAVKAAPFVAPFNPALAGVMSGVGTFDQTGSISSGLKSGAMNYGGGQLARYAGGAGFQGNPFGDGGAFTGSGFRGGFSSPLGNKTGLGKFFSNQGTDAVQGIGTGTTGDANIAEQIAAQGRTVNADSTGLFAEGLTGGTEVLANEVSLVPNAIIDKSVVTKEPGFLKNMFDGISNQDYGKVAKTIGDGAKKFGKAMFTNKDGSIDKAAVLGAVAFSASYAEAKALAADAGVEITPEEYDEATKADKQEEYAGYLTNFFGGQKDGGRIGYESGANEYITKRERKNPMRGLGGLLGGLDPTIDESGQNIIIVMTENGPQAMTESEFNEQMGINNGIGPIVIDMMNFGDEKKPRIIDLGKDMKKDGGRINRRLGSPEKGESEIGIMSIDVEAGDDEGDELDGLLAGLSFSSAEKSFLFKRLGGSGGASRSYTMPQLYKILSNPGAYPNDARALKEITIGLGIGKKDGGRIGFAFGTPDKNMEITDELDVNTIYRPNADFNKNIEVEDESSITLPDNTMMAGNNRIGELLFIRSERMAKDEDYSDIDAELRTLGYFMKAEGGIMQAKMPTGKIRQNNAGVVERDYRDEGGFVPVGIKERADDVPAMLSKNEFVITADAVRGIGNGSVEEGSKKLYNTMKQAEQKGKTA